MSSFSMHEEKKNLIFPYNSKISYNYMDRQSAAMWIRTDVSVRPVQFTP